MPDEVLPTEGLVRAAVIVNADINYAEVGDSDTEPNVADTGLNGYTNRKATTTRVNTSKTFQNRVFFPNADLPTTVEEVGFYMNGAAGESTGSLILHALVEFTKGTNDLYLIFEATMAEG